MFCAQINFTCKPETLLHRYQKNTWLCFECTKMEMHVASPSVAMLNDNALSSLYIDQCCRLERRKYYKHCRKARQEPDKHMSIILDGMDQAKTNLPHFQQKTKQTSGSWKLKTHVTGAIVHGQGVYGYYVNGHILLT